MRLVAFAFFRIDQPNKFSLNVVPLWCICDAFPPCNFPCILGTCFSPLQGTFFPSHMQLCGKRSILESGKIHIQLSCCVSMFASLRSSKTKGINLFNPIPGEMIQLDEHIFQMGWFNHQLHTWYVYIYYIYIYTYPSYIPIDIIIIHIIYPSSRSHPSTVWPGGLTAVEEAVRRGTCWAAICLC